MSTNKKFGLSEQELANRELPFREGLFAGQTVVISGGSGGIGRAMAWLFGRLGAQVAICGRNSEKLEATAAPMRAAGLVVESFICNIRKHDEVETFFTAVVERFGSFDLLINSAGGQFPQLAIDFAPKGWNAVMGFEAQWNGESS